MNIQDTQNRIAELESIISELKPKVDSALDYHKKCQETFNESFNAWMELDQKLFDYQEELYKLNREVICAIIRENNKTSEK